MTVTANSYTPLTYNGNGSTTVFSVTYQFYDLLVTHIDSSGSETVWVENTDFTVTGGAGSTGSITATTAPASGEQLRIERDTDKAQGEDYDLDNEVVEASLQSSVDKLAMIMQELVFHNNRRPAISIANYTGPVEFPAASTGSVLSWAADGNLANTALVDLNGVAISALTATASLENTDIFPLYDNSAGDNAGITWANFLSQVNANITPEYADNVFRIQDNGDATKELAFEVSEIATGTTRTLTIPNSDVDLGDIADKASTADLASTDNAKGASLIGVEDDNSWFDGSDQEAVNNQLYRPLLHIQDQKSSGTDGGTFTSGSWQTRDLNTTLTNEITGASLSSNQITLPAGTYYVRAHAASFSNQENKVKIRNTTDSTDVLIGSTSYGSSSNGGFSFSEVRGRFTLASTKTIELQHRCSTTKSTNGFGRACGYSVVEVYSDIEIRKVA